MRTSALSACVALVSLAGSALAHNINLKAHSRECFHEELHKDDKMTVSFQVGDREFGGSANLEVDFWVRPPCPVFGACRPSETEGWSGGREQRGMPD
jgi:hypothetical protein